MRRTIFGNWSSFIGKTWPSHLNLYLIIALKSSIELHFLYSLLFEIGSVDRLPRAIHRQFLWKTFSKFSSAFQSIHASLLKCSLEAEGAEVGTSKYFPETYFSQQKHPLKFHFPNINRIAKSSLSTIFPHNLPLKHYKTNLLPSISYLSYQLFWEYLGKILVQLLFVIMQRDCCENKTSRDSSTD